MLLLHGFGADLNGWMFNQPALSDGRRVVALDLPGHGGSSRDVGAGDGEAFSRAVEGFLATLDLGRAHLVGHSMGGAIAALLAARRPDLVRTLTLIAPAGLGPDINAAFIDGFVRASRRKDAVEVLQLLVHDPALVSRTMVEDVLRFKRLDGVTAALETIVRAWFPGAADARPGGGDRRVGVARAGHLGARRPDHSGRARGEAGIGGSGACAGCGRSSAAHGKIRRGEPADPPVHRRMTHDR